MTTAIEYNPPETYAPRGGENRNPAAFPPRQSPRPPEPRDAGRHPGLAGAAGGAEGGVGGRPPLGTGPAFVVYSGNFETGAGSNGNLNAKSRP